MRDRIVVVGAGDWWVIIFKWTKKLGYEVDCATAAKTV